jgi:predicted ATPase
VTELTVSDDGRLSSWPEGFFDQIERDLARL